MNDESPKSDRAKEDPEPLTEVEREIARRQSIGRQLYDVLVSDVAKEYGTRRE